MVALIIRDEEAAMPPAFGVGVPRCREPIVARVSVQIAETADVAPDAVIGAGTTIWHLAQIREHAVIGEACTVGRGVYVGAGVSIGARCKLQNYALVYEPATLADGVFIGPAAVLTNDRLPRAIDTEGRLKSAADWVAVGVTVHEGASIGARAVCVGPVTVGRWSMVAAGAVVTRNVPDFALVAGVPARRIGWVGHGAEALRPDGPGRWVSSSTGEEFVEYRGGLVEASA